MIRIIIEIDDKQVSFTSSSPAPPPELLARATELGATSAGGAPGEPTPAELASTAASDAGAAPEADAASIASSEESKPPRRSR